MIDHISHALSGFFSSKTIILCVCVVLLFSLLPMQFAQATLLDDIKECGGLVIPTLISTCLAGKLAFGSLGHAVLGGLLNAVGGVLDLTIGLLADFAGEIANALGQGMEAAIKLFINIPISPSNPGTPSAIKEAWSATRDLVNIVFILILTFIGLATILRIQNYQLQKTLPSLIIIALLVNFSGVLVGFVADMGNIITQAFFNNDLVKNFTIDKDEFPVFNGLAGFGTSLVKFLFYVVSALIYFMVMLLFGIRVIILWTLVILAPIAFAAYILPGTKKYWTQWLQQLIQWSILGIPISFTLFIAKMVITSGTGSFEFTGAILSFFAPITALVILFLGITLSMQLAPAGAQGIVNFAKKLPKRITETRLGAKAAAWGASKTQGALSGLAPALKNLEGKGPLGKVAGMALRPSGWAAQGVNRLAGPKLIEYAASKEKIKPPSGFETWTGPKQEAWIKARRLDPRDQLQLASTMAEKDTLGQTSKEFRTETKNNARDAILREDMSYKKEAGNIVKAFPEILAKGTDDDKTNVLLHMRLTGKVDPKERADTTNEVKQETDGMKKKIESLWGDDLVIEAGIKYKKIEKDSLDGKYYDLIPDSKDLAKSIRTGTSFDKSDAVGIASLKGSITQLELDKFVTDSAAAASYIAKYKTGDISKLDDVKNFTTRIGLASGSSGNLQKTLEEFGRTATEDAMNGTGGVNSTTDTSDKADEFYWSNPALFRSLVTTSAGQNLPFAGRDHMRDIDGNPTRDFRKYEEWLNRPSAGGRPGAGGPGAGGPGAGGPGAGGPGAGRPGGRSRPLGSGPSKGAKKTRPGTSDLAQSQASAPVTPREQQQQESGTQQLIRPSILSQYLQTLRERTDQAQETINKTEEALEKRMREHMNKPPTSQANPQQQAPPATLASGESTQSPSSAQTIPDWLQIGLESIANGNVPFFISRRLEEYLKNNGLSDTEINSMTPQQAWEKARELSGGEQEGQTPATGAATTSAAEDTAASTIKRTNKMGPIVKTVGTAYASAKKRRSASKEEKKTVKESIESLQNIIKEYHRALTSTDSRFIDELISDTPENLQQYKQEYGDQVEKVRKLAQKRLSGRQRKDVDQILQKANEVQGLLNNIQPLPPINPVDDIKNLEPNINRLADWRLTSVPNALSDGILKILNQKTSSGLPISDYTKQSLSEAVVRNIQFLYFDRRFLKRQPQASPPRTSNPLTEEQKEELERLSNNSIPAMIVEIERLADWRLTILPKSLFDYCKELLDNGEIPFEERKHVVNEVLSMIKNVYLRT